MIKHKGNGTHAYSETYPNAKSDSARACASELLAKPSVRERVVKLMDETGLSIPELNQKLKKFTNSENEGIGLDATKFAYKLQDAIPNEGTKNSQTHIESIEITFVSAKNVLSDSEKKASIDVQKTEEK